MAISYLQAIFLVWVCDAAVTSEGDLRREHFPDGFLFGTSSSSYQFEGSILEDGKSLSNWDVFTHEPGMIAGGTNGDVATDHYHRYMEDIELMQSLGADAYRFSISWSRILPEGRFGDVNPSGVMFYNKIIDELLLRGIQPFVTIHHCNFPKKLEDRYGSWLHPQMQDEFLLLADVCFRSFGDRVKYWITINEPNLITLFEFFYGVYPPLRCSQPFGNCSSGNSDTEPFAAAHNMIMSHVKAAHLYRSRYKAGYGGHVGITISAQMFWPLREIDDDYKAVDRALAFSIAWILDPLVFGHYPPEMVELIGEQLPRFPSSWTRMRKNSIDFIGVNHYSTNYVKDCINTPCKIRGSSVGGFTYVTGFRGGVPIGEPTAMESSYVVPEGMENVILYIRRRYDNLPMYVTENGYAGPGEPGSVESELNDVERVHYHSSYLRYLHKAIRNGADVRGYFVWSLLDNFEWASGFTLRFGLYHVDFNTLKRSPKLSASWYRGFLTSKSDDKSILQRNSSEQRMQRSFVKLS